MKLIFPIAALAVSLFMLAAPASAICLTGCTNTTTATYEAGSVGAAGGFNLGRRGSSIADTYTSNQGDVTVHPNGNVHGFVNSSAGAYSGNTAWGRNGSAAFSAGGVIGGATVTVTRERGRTGPPSPF